MNRIGRSTIICLLIATAPIWALLARKLSSQLLESVTDGQTKRSASRGAEWNSVRSKKCAALASDLGRGHQHYAGEPDWFRETNPGLSLCEVVSALDHQHSEALRRPQLDPRAGAVSLGEALTIHRPDMLRATNTIR